MNYPTYKELSRAARNAQTSADYPALAIIGDCATQHIATALKGIFSFRSMHIRVVDTDYDQINAQVLDPASELYEAKPETVFFCTCTEKLYQHYCDTPLKERTEFARRWNEQFEQYRGMINSRLHTKIFQLTFPQMNDAAFGGYASKVKDSFPYQLRQLNTLLFEASEREKNLFLVDADSLQSIIGRQQFHSDKMYYLARMPFSHDGLAMIACQTADTLQALCGKIKKCVVLDLDNTLWGGVIGDDGINGIQIGELGTGRAFLDFQLWLKELSKRGILLTVCSKNQEAAAKEPFEKHPDMVLHLDDIALFVANWEDKASNIRRIQQTLDIGMDSLVFIDDNPFERNAVRSLIPEITVPEMPEDPADYVTYLRELNLFETASYSDNDQGRTAQYQARVRSLEAQSAFTNYDDYLKSLNMKAVAAPFDPFHFPRIAQLTQRSNQFNLRTGRYTEGDIAEIAGDPNVITIWFGLKDNFADYGLISLVILDKKPDRSLFIREWLMSCRVLKRGMEEFVADTIVSTAKEQGFRHVTGEYLPTAKNAMVSNLLERMGFTRDGDYFSADTETYPMHTVYIEKE